MFQKICLHNHVDLLDEYLNQLKTRFNEAMASDSSLVNHVVLRDCGEAFRGFEALVDVGGGTGEMARAISVVFPDMACVVLDLPHVIAGSKGKDNLTYVEGDMSQADLILLKSILHNWDDKDSVKILKKCREAIGCSSNERGGKVMIINMVLNNHGGSTPLRPSDDDVSQRERTG
ncbi:trans-resveratrol di-O-methyltransferase [Salvia divinorum]|uniref:Trans-resveratrol di-O-methyltransferase n=1 Tax=Salvia divinorum TaxID=28513 RepID=A0ABD1HJ89_SALDI